MSLEAGSSTVRRPPSRPTLPTTRHVSLMLQPLPQSQPDGGSTPQDGRRDPRSHQRHTGRDRPLCPTTVSYHCVHDQHHTDWERVRRGLPTTVSKRCTHDRPPAQGLGTVHRGLGDLGVRACRDPPIAVPASASTKPRHRTQSVHSGLHVRRRIHSEAFPGLPRRTGPDGMTTPPPYSKDGPLRRPRRHRNRLQGPDTPPLFTRRRIVSSCTAQVLPSCYKRRGPGLF